MVTQLTAPIPALGVREQRSSAVQPRVAVLLLFGITLFLSASLLFLIQPLFAKMVLPRLGGTPAVWNTCMVFFQAALLGGYLYAHLTPRWLGLRRQVAVHLILLAMPLFFLPLHLPSGWEPSLNHPTASLLGLLAVCVGVPFFIVSTTGPLLQKWFTATGHVDAVDPYFLYAAGNTGSLLALLGYPVFCEPFLRLQLQSHVWSIGYGLLAVAIFLCAMTVWRYSPRVKPLECRVPKSPIATSARLRWVWLAFIPSSYLLGVTTYMTTDIAAVPLFWIIPLAIYLISFVLVFLKTPLLSHAMLLRLLPVAILGTVLFQLAHAVQPVWLVLLMHLATFFLAAMVCHGELAMHRPAAEHLTDFYLMMSVGGVLGGLFNAILAPILFNRAYEYPIAIILVAWVSSGWVSNAKTRRSDAQSTWFSSAITLTVPLLVGLFAWRAPSLIGSAFGGVPAATILLGVGIPILICFFFRDHRTRFALTVAALLAVAMLHVPNGGTTLQVRRSFYGVHRIVLSKDGLIHELYHGATVHGRQAFDASHQPIDVPLSYYHRSGPAGDVFTRLPHRHVALIGLGVGSLAAYADRHDFFTYFEIDPDVLWAADQSRHFHFLQSARQRGALIDVVLGDARLTLRHATAARNDLIVLDAFSGDAVPVHLLTREAIQLYLSKLAPGGVLAVHTSNIYLDLRPVLASLANDAHCAMLYCEDLDVSPTEMANGKSPSQWVAIAPDERSLAPLLQAGHWQSWTTPLREPWTDDFSDVLCVMRWKQ